MYYEAENLKREWGAVMSSLPKEFARSYKANMERPLFDMKDRATETADQMELVARRTRAAAFDAEKFGAALRDAQADRLAGDYPDSPFPSNTRGGGTKMPVRPAPSGGDDTPAPTTRGGGAGRAAPAPQSNLDALRERGQTDPRARAEMMRLQNDMSRAMSRAGDLRERGMFGAAADAEIRAEKRLESAADKIAAREAATDMFGGTNSGEAFRNFRDMMREGGMLSGMNQSQFDKFFQDQVKTEREREEEKQSGGQAGGGGGGGGPDPLSDISGKIDKVIQEITDRLPQNALAYN
jgi:hypothetical protein